MIRYKINVLAALKQAGYNQTVIREQNILGQSYVSKIRQNQLVSYSALNTICRLLCCQPGDILEYVPDRPDNNK